MSEGGLQFDKAESAAPLSVACGHCKSPGIETYFELNGKVVCPACRDRIGGFFNSPAGRETRALEATMLGIGGGFAGAALYFALFYFLHLQVGLVAIVVGWLVGVGVRKGARYRGGIAYQLLAVALTYLAIVSAFAAAAIVEMTRHDGVFPEVGVVIATFLTSILLPFFIATESPITLLIIGFALWQAWSLNRRPKLSFNGPFQVATRPPPAPPVAPAP